jgi:CBS domain containing-hemolysin-like protein
MTFEWISDPTAWAGLFSLVLLELILGIDNLVFIAILAQKLPPKQRDYARRLGLSLALGMRIVLLVSISWIATLTEPVLDILGHSFSGRDLIMLVGGLFLLWKATMEIHGRLEGKGHRKAGVYKAKFWMVITQIVVLDAVFSLDAVITAVGMVDHLSIMIIAVTLAIGLMVLTSKPLTEFVNKHPTIVMLCLGFLLMVGFSLIAEGFGMHIPKGYLYAAIGFSILIETINQFARVKLKKRVVEIDNVRQRTADAILKVLGAKSNESAEEAQESSAILQEAARGSVITAGEKELLRGVLNLSERPVHTIMTPRMDVEYIDIKKPSDEVLNEIRTFGRSHILVVDGEVDNVLGILRRDDFLVSCLDPGEHILSSKILHEPMFVQKQSAVMNLLEIFKKQPIEMAVVIDEFGSVEGVVTHIDLLEAIAGEFPDRDQPDDVSIAEGENGELIVDGLTSIYDIRNKLGVDYEPDGRFGTIGGLVLHDLGRVPTMGDKLEWVGYEIEVIKMDSRRIDKVKMTKKPTVE